MEKDFKCHLKTRGNSGAFVTSFTCKVKAKTGSEALDKAEAIILEIIPMSTWMEKLYRSEGAKIECEELDE